MNDQVIESLEYLALSLLGFYSEHTGNYIHDNNQQADDCSFHSGHGRQARALKDEKNAMTD